MHAGWNSSSGFTTWSHNKLANEGIGLNPQGYIHTTQDDFSTSWKFLRLELPFTRNRANRAKFSRLARIKNSNAKTDVKFLAGQVENLTGAVWTRWPSKRLYYKEVVTGRGI